MSTEEVARSFAQRIDQRDWAGLAALMSPDFHGEYRHDGLSFDRESWVAYNADYPVQSCAS